MFLFLALLSDVLSAVWAASAWGEHRLVVRCLRALPVVSLSEQEVARAAGGVASPLPFFAFAIPPPKTANQSRKKKKTFYSIVVTAFFDVLTHSTCALAILGFQIRISTFLRTTTIATTTPKETGRRRNRTERGLAQSCKPGILTGCL